MKARLAIGVGCASTADAEAIAALVREVLAGVEGIPFGLFTRDALLTHPGLIAAASALNLPLKGLTHAALAAAAPRTLTRSPLIEARYALPSIAETAALAGAGVGAILVVPRRMARGVTCALARRYEA